MATVSHVDTPEACEHLACVYRDSTELAAAVGEFLAEGFGRDEPALVVATAAHWPLFARELARRGWDADVLQSRGELYLADADATLAAILDAGSPSPARFEAVIGALLDTAAGESGRFVRVFGEMVDLLCKSGDHEAAAELEDIWNDAATRRRFSLLCGYGVDLFDRRAQTLVMPEVCRTHTHVAAAPDAEVLDGAVDRALVKTLGAHDAEKVYALAAGPKHPDGVPTAQLVLMWVSAHMPRTADRVLAVARENYLAASTPPASRP